MATTRIFMEYVTDQLRLVPSLRCRPLMGEYGLWRAGQFFGTIEDNMLCLKITPAGRDLLPGAREVEPHPGARYLYVEDLDDPEFLARLVEATCVSLPPPRHARQAKNQK